MTNQDGLDTRIVVTNTSRNPFGITRQQGPVTLYFYGSKPSSGPAPPNNDSLFGQAFSFKTQPIPAGEQLMFSLSSGGNFGMPAVPSFQGYIYAVASFQYCHALALIGDTSGKGLAQSYLAVRIPSQDGSPNPTVD